MIDYVILSNTRTDKDYKMTTDLIRSLQDAAYPNENGFEAYRMTIVEKQSRMRGL